MIKTSIHYLQDFQQELHELGITSRVSSVETARKIVISKSLLDNDSGVFTRALYFFKMAENSCQSGGG